MRSEEKYEKINVLVFLWHPTADSAVTAGGFRRILEFSKRIPRDFHLYILDSSPTLFSFQSQRYTVFEYKVPKVIFEILRRNFVLGRFLEWLIASVKLLVNGNRILRQKKCQVIYLPVTELLFLFLPAMLLSIIYRKKIVCDILNFEMPYGSIINFYRKLHSQGYSVIRSLSLPLHTAIQYFIIKLCFKKIDCIISVSKHLADCIRKAGATSYVGFTPSGIDVSFIEGVSDIPKVFDGVYVGRHGIEKGIFDLLEAWRQVENLSPGSRLVMVGPCDNDTKKQIEEKLVGYGIKDRVVIKGVLSEEDKIKTIKSAKVFIHLGKIEPLVPVITVLEALASGLPVVLYDQPSYREHPEIYHHQAFALAPVEDYRAVAEHIISFMNINGSARDSLSRQAKEYAKKYNWENISQIEFKAIGELIT